LVKAHVEHFVALVKYLVVAVADIQSEVLAKVNQSARRSHQHLRLLLFYLKHYILLKLRKSYFAHSSERRRRKQGLI
jgi:hypothetical protein